MTRVGACALVLAVALPAPAEATSFAGIVGAVPGFLGPSLAERVRESVARDIPETMVLKRVQVAWVPKLQGQVSVVVEWKRPPAVGAQTVRVAFVQDDRVERSFARVDLAELRVVARAKRDLLPGEQIDEVDFELTWMDVGRLRAARIGHVRGATLVRSVDKGDVICMGDLAPLPPVARGSRVTAVVRRGAIEVMSGGALEDDARLGDPVRVRLDTGRVVTGSMVDHETVEIGGGRK
ncbi:MAG: flagellar basal body P-ring formation protein FlgA [Deltaproteobacteria bacterium]|nr:flagellar basal body P-ring formation protein FlgA [Deltaproteobacteria bacterium]